MSPTLRPGDRVEVAPLAPDTVLKNGDVIVFLSPVDQQGVVHRIIAQCRGAICTRGDNNPSCDNWSLSRRHLLGRVQKGKRQNRPILVLHGRPGLLWAQLHGLKKSLRTAGRRFFSPFYFKICQQTAKVLFPRLWERGYLRLLHFTTSKGIECQLSLGSRHIGIRRPDHALWHIRPMYRLLVDGKALQRVSAGPAVERGNLPTHVSSTV